SPLRWMFDKVVQRWSSTPGLGGYRGLWLGGVDGTHLRVPDSDENFEHFGNPGGRAGSNDAGYPQTCLVAVDESVESSPVRRGDRSLVKIGAYTCRRAVGADSRQ